MSDYSKGPKLGPLYTSGTYSKGSIDTGAIHRAPLEAELSSLRARLADVETKLATAMRAGAAMSEAHERALARLAETEKQRDTLLAAVRELNASEQAFRDYAQSHPDEDWAPAEFYDRQSKAEERLAALAALPGGTP